jgi:hypothetical protein
MNQISIVFAKLAALLLMLKPHVFWVIKILIALEPLLKLLIEFFK